MATSPSAARRRIAYPSMSTVDGPCRSVKPANQRGSRSGSTSTHRPVMAPPRSASSARRRHDVPAGPRFARSWHDRAMSLPGTVLERLMATYGSARDDERAAAMRAYMRDQFPFFGITNARRRALSREVLAGLPRPDEADLREVALACWKLPEREYQYFACDWLRRHARVCTPDFLATARTLITDKSWWDTVDALAAHLVGPIVANHPAIVSTMDEWAGEENTWLARTAILHQLTYKEATDTERLYRSCSRPPVRGRAYRPALAPVGARGAQERGLTLVGVCVQGLPEVALGPGADDRADDLSPAEHQQRRQGHDSIGPRDVRVLVAVERGDDDPFAELSGQLGEALRDHLAGRAPVRPEIDHDGPVAGQDRLGEGVVGDGDQRAGSRLLKHVSSRCAIAWVSWAWSRCRTALSRSMQASTSASLRRSTATESGHTSPELLPARRQATNGRMSSRPKPTASRARISCTIRSSASS